MGKNDQARLPTVNKTMFDKGNWQAFTAVINYILVSFEDIRVPFNVTGKQQGPVASLMSGQESDCCLSDAPTRPVWSLTLSQCQAPTLGLDSREEDPWFNVNMHPERYYVCDLHMDSFRTLGVANKLLKVHAMQAQLDKLSAMDANLKLLGEVPIRPDRFRLHRSGQTGKFPTCFVQE